MVVNKNAKRVLMYGDSYIHGKIPGGLRYDSETRFTGVMQKILGNNYEIIEEGLRGRMIEGENKFFPNRDGQKQFDGIIGSHIPVDLVVFLLGTNDTNSGSTKSPAQIADEYRGYLDKINSWCESFQYPKPKVVLIAPPIVMENDTIKVFGQMFKGAQQKSKELVREIEKFAKKNNLAFFDASRVVEVSPIDGLHFDVDSNKILGQKLADFVKGLF